MNMLCRLEIARNHASFAGHFPRFPILPGAVLLDEALAVIARDRGIDLIHWRIASAKFLDVVRPGDELSLEHDAPANGSIRFTIRVADRAVASGVLSTAPEDGSAWRPKE
jgi:3-hydroxymyristoyl/3-hydroxydecanoyl-(acyl carrier protein) dehydratase